MMVLNLMIEIYERKLRIMVLCKSKGLTHRLMYGSLKTSAERKHGFGLLHNSLELQHLEKRATVRDFHGRNLCYSDHFRGGLKDDLNRFHFNLYAKRDKVMWAEVGISLSVGRRRGLERGLEGGLERGLERTGDDGSDLL